MELPFNQEAEKQVLANMLFSKDVMVETFARINANDFYLETNQIIFNSLRELYEKNIVNIDAYALIDTLSNANNLEKVGGASYILELADAYNDVSNARYYIDSIEQKSILRKIILYSKNIVDKWQNDSATDIESYINKVSKDIGDITKNRNSGDLTSMEQAFKIYKEKVTAIRSGKIETGGLKTGYTIYDAMLQGFKAGEISILAARPSVGKSALALNFLVKTALRTDKPCVFFSLEMGVDSVCNRILSAQSNVPMKKIQNAHFNNQEEENINKAIRDLTSTNLFIDDTPAIKISAIRSKLNKLQARYGCVGLVVIDYIGLITPDVKAKKDSTRSLELGQISAALKAVARDYKCPVLVLSQLNRGVEDRKDMIPTLSDLRESGAIEQDADVVMFIHRPDYGKMQEAKTGEENENSESDSAVSLIVAKNRNGELCTIDFMFKKHIGKFVEMDKNR